MNLAPIEAPRSAIVTEGLLNDSFSFLGDWQNYDEAGLFIDVIDGQLQIDSSWRGQFVWTSNYKSYQDNIIEADIDWQSDERQAMTGIMCRVQETGSGYYVLVSYIGQYSIRRVGRNQDTALRRWQSHANVPSNGETFQMRVVCVDDYIGLYINGQYVDGAVDSLYREGYIALVAGLPPSAAQDDTVVVSFDNLRVWEAELK